ncbi:MAG: hypothetical protein KGK07_17485 [Chloroflexota bacterium]|nr:hypothetical protein [Chloroflexota bacterium]
MALASHVPSTGIPFRDRLSCTKREACEATGLSLRTIHRRIADGSLATREVHGRRLILVPSLVRLIGAGESPR